MNKLRLIAGLLLYITMAATFAAQLPANYPTGFSQAGNIDAVDLNARTIIIGDMTFPLAEVVRVHETNGQSRSLSGKDVGAVVGVTARSGGRGLVREIWLLPRGYMSSGRPVRR